MTTETANFIIALVEAREALAKAQAVKPEGFDAFCAELDAI